MKTVLFIPGYREDLEARDYRAVIGAIERKGYAVHFVPINWLRTTIDDWVKEVEREYSKYDSEDTILAGFSYGAMIAFVAASRRSPFQLWLFSLSGYFEEDINSSAMKNSWLKSIGHRRVSAFNNLSYTNLAPRVGCKTLLFAGSEEIDKWPTMKYRTFESPKYLQNATLTIVENVGHDVANKAYIKSIEALI